jgi:predicted nuclease with TOPRIM domain
VNELIPIVAVVFIGLTMLQRMKLRTAERMERLRGEGGADHSERLAHLEHDVDQLRSQLAETQERVDFAERMLARVRDAQRLPPPAQ